MEINTIIQQDDFVPPELWGRDHWSTLAYIETKLVEGEYHVQFDPRMRQKRRTYRVLLESRNKSHGDADRQAIRGIPMQPEHGSRLLDGTYLPWHDDWDCVQDMIQVGLFAGEVDNWEPGFPIVPTEKFFAVTAALRKHKIGGGTFSNCSVVVLEAMKVEPIKA